ncbi:adenosylcobinamide kinase/adenosylcobinamide phosphate guanyltransferase [Tistrella bauzanensis]|uniref:Bifunctional adenosylcobalamin biosynthesis protein n=1 Tax=Tistrella bauzanensis TaxID=657419 RepID=A0ABQ1IRX2_9PROT|nr:bifunctional adenosylcobinamide kinase/adenosylcobinamide-phosphate guanylyltransferase [Tistrella bauzanensis]GGB48883.1 adenosylcobinamide kinase/adenosylcobinamide phosphate guanyltransferase [Tistrella bauzanensis]
MTARLTLVLGGARSGKSALAERLTRAAAAGGPLVYVATAQAFDDEMRERIARHVADRGPDWTTIEAPDDPAAAITAAAGMAAGGAVLIDCLTIWAATLMHLNRDPDKETARLVEAARDAGRPVVMVSNEVGLGIVPDNALARRFRDVAGRMNQQVAAAADRVVFVAAGLPLVMKGAALGAEEVAS